MDVIPLLVMAAVAAAPTPGPPNVNAGDSVYRNLRRRKLYSGRWLRLAGCYTVSDQVFQGYVSHVDHPRYYRSTSSRDLVYFLTRSCRSRQELSNAC